MFDQDYPLLWHSGHFFVCKTPVRTKRRGVLLKFGRMSLSLRLLAPKRMLSPLSPQYRPEKDADVAKCGNFPNELGFVRENVIYPFRQSRGHGMSSVSSRMADDRLWLSSGLRV